MSNQLHHLWIALATAIALCHSVAFAQGFRHVTTADGVDVWAVGDAGSMYRSVDGGATWTSQSLGSASLQGVAARGLNVWVVDAAGNLWTSTDGGYAFTSQQPSGGTPLHDICFASDLDGWIVGDGGTILRTANAGVDWLPQTSGTSADLFAVRFTGVQDGWAAGAGGTVAHTTDGGVSWTASTPFASGRDLLTVAFSGAEVWVAGKDAFTAHSTDSGSSWTPVDLGIASRVDVDDAVLLGDGTLWLCGGGGFLRRSTDGGKSWTYPQHKIVSGVSSLYFHDALHGWAAVARSKSVACTTDGGATWSIPGGGNFSVTWTQKLSSGSASIRGNTLVIDPFNRDKLYCVQGRTVYASWNRGDTWTSIATISGAGSRTNAFLVAPTDTLTWLAIVQDGDRVTRTTDGGATWTATLTVPFTEYGLPLEQDPNEPNTVYFGPEDGKFWKSTDFGATWVAHANPGFRSPDDIVAVKDTTGVLYVSDGVTGSGSGQIFKSSDGGLTWSLKRTVTGSEIPTIGSSWLDPWVAYSTNWSSGGVQRTLDMGDTWPNVASTTSAWGVDIAKDDPNLAVYAVYSGGKCYLSLDKGTTFASSNISGANYAVLTYDRGTYLCHQSGGIYKATLTQPDMPVNNLQILSLLAPNGGEAWAFDESRSIQWSSQNVPWLRLEYQTVGLGPWKPIVAATAGPAGTYSWNIPNDPTDTARVRASDLDGTPVDESNATFRIVVPSIATSSEVLDFGAVPIGSALAETLLVTNSGTATLVVSGVTIESSGPFTPLPTSFSVPPDGDVPLVVVFEPVTATSYNDVLVLTSNAPTSPTLVRLGGIGAPPVDAGEERLAGFRLAECRPNPFGSTGTVISYNLPLASEVSLVVYNALGQVVARLVDSRQPAGRYAVRFPSVGANLSSGIASTLPSGVYFARLRAGSHTSTRQVVYVR